MEEAVVCKGAMKNRRPGLVVVTVFVFVVAVTNHGTFRRVATRPARCVVIPNQLVLFYFHPPESSHPIHISTQERQEDISTNIGSNIRMFSW